MPIYFAESPEGGPIKIGCSVDIPTRIKMLQNHYRQPLVLLATLPGGSDEERAIHERFAEHRLGRTEQFRPVAEIMAFIGCPLRVCPDPEAVELMKPVARKHAALVRIDDDAHELAATAAGLMRVSDLRLRQRRDPERRQAGYPQDGEEAHRGGPGVIYEVVVWTNIPVETTYRIEAGSRDEAVAEARRCRHAAVAEARYGPEEDDIVVFRLDADGVREFMPPRGR